MPPKKEAGQFPASAFGYQCLDISFPALQRYVTEISGDAELTSVTAQLRSSLYKTAEQAEVRR